MFPLGVVVAACTTQKERPAAEGQAPCRAEEQAHSAAIPENPHRLLRHLVAGRSGSAVTHRCDVWNSPAVNRRLLPITVSLAALLWNAAGSASPSYPGVIQNELGMACPPACTLCHTTARGGNLTANAPFGVATRQAGLDCCKPDELSEILGSLEQQLVDSDEDGVADVAELRENSDPNSDAVPIACVPSGDPGGCSLRAGAPESRPEAVLATASLALLCALPRARKRWFARPQNRR